MSAQGLSPRDPSSYSRPELAIVSSISLNVTVDFERKIFHGSVDLQIVKNDPNVKDVILDSQDLVLSKVVNKESNETLKYTLGEKNGEFGSKLTVELPTSSSELVNITIFFENSPEASGLQWLTANQTAGKRYPFVFSQFQAIHARSFFPCQDTPAVKTKYVATVAAPKHLTVLMSAIPKETKIVGDLKQSLFVQQIPIPAYLIAIAIGGLESRKLGPRSHVWAEKEIVDACAYEFANTEHQLKTAEEICGPYVWGIYDLLVLPPSFAFGGMENPCLTFVTPTLLAGDRSLANVVAHEIAHSWTGNLITNRNFEHFWLNEGFTVFVERKIKGRLTSAEEQDFDAYGGLTELRETIKRLGNDNPLTNLVVDLTNTHPDDAFSSVPYEKGQTFLRYLETVIGGPAKFEPFLRKYFENFQYKSIDTTDFQDFFTNYFSNDSSIKSIDWDTWLHKPGMPPVIPEYNTSLAQECDKIVNNVVSWNESKIFPLEADTIKNLTPDQRIYLLQKLTEVDSLPIIALQQLDKLFLFDTVKNAEIKYRWFKIGIKAHWQEIVTPTINWLNEVGRMKYVRPLYRALYNWEVTRERAIENFKSNRKYMMHVLAYTLAKDLHLSN